MSEDELSLTCTVAVQRLNSSASVLKHVSYQNAFLRLGRNEFRDIILKIEAGKFSTQYNLHNITIHKRFLKDGKATIRFQDQNFQIMLSNCPPSKLSLFLKTICIKTECKKTEKVLSQRQRLLSEKSRSFEEISPLTMKDVNTAINNKTKLQNVASLQETPKSSKRKRNYIENNDIENNSAQKKAIIRQFNPIQMTNEQKHVLNAVLSGKNVFFTGSAGTGKSFLLKRIVAALPPETTFATASTGVAACQIGGITLHSFAGIGSGNAPLQQCIQQALRKSVAHNWKKCQHLVVDEISMIDGEYFQKLEKVARAVRNSDKPFGGIQLVLSGDFLQLPPVAKKGEEKIFCFQCPAWRKCIQLNMELTQVKRQNDLSFINILHEIRMGRCSESTAETLSATSKNVIEKEGIIATRLCTHKDDVEFLNESRLNKLPAQGRVFKAFDSEPSLSKFLDAHCPVGEQLILKEGTQVMLMKNMDVQRGLVNGARGVVIEFESGKEGLPIVKFMCGAKEVIKSERWNVKSAGGNLLTRRQLPLKLAWALSIHKSQGMTLDCVEISLSRVFEQGQAYVALSRSCSLQGLRIVDFDQRCVRANSEVLKFYEKLKTEQHYLKTTLQDFY